MSYPKDLDEIPSEVLASELSRRCYEFSRDRCPYCGMKLTKIGDKVVCQCKFGNNLLAYHKPYVLKSLQYGD